MLSDRNKIKKMFSERSKRKLSTKQLESLVDEYLDNQFFIEDNELTVRELPTKTEIKRWFKDAPKSFVVENNDGSVEKLLEIDIDSIYREDSIAQEVFKGGYAWKWEQGKEVPDFVKKLIKLNNVAKKSNIKENREISKSKLANICMIGIIRFYNMEREPYLCPSQIIKSVEYFKKSLTFLSSVINGKYDEKIVNGELYIFDPFENDYKEI